MPNVNVPGGDFKRFAEFARGALVSVGIGSFTHRNGGGSERNPKGWEVAKKFESKVAIFLNRLLGLPVQQQTLLFGYFVDTHEGEVVEAKSRGTFDDGIVSLAAESITVVPGFPRTIHRDRASGAVTQLCQISIDRGLSWEGALAKLADFEKLSAESAHEVAPENGFWVSTYQAGVALSPLDRSQSARPRPVHTRSHPPSTTITTTDHSHPTPPPRFNGFQTFLIPSPLFHHLYIYFFGAFNL